MTLACGQSLSAIAVGIAERTPKRLASYEQEATTRSPPPIITEFLPIESCSIVHKTQKSIKSICTIAPNTFYFLGYKISTDKNIFPIIFVVTNYNKLVMSLFSDNIRALRVKHKMQKSSRKPCYYKGRYVKYEDGTSEAPMKS
jgi:hypothetical protein